MDYNQVNSHYLSILWLSLSFFAGISIVLVWFTTIEFILAQGPRTMQGLLIGIWLINNTIYCLHLTLGSSQYGCYWEYYAVKTGVVFISVIVYTIAACTRDYLLILLLRSFLFCFVFSS